MPGDSRGHAMLSRPTITPASAADVPAILAFIRELAAYEKLLDRVEATEELLREGLFGPRPVAEVLMARLDDKPVGYALFFHSYSTFLARPGIYLEDIYVQPAVRGRGVGKALLIEIARIARDRNCGRLEWSVLDWNQPAIDFYLSLGAKPLNEWTMYRMDELAIATLAK